MRFFDASALAARYLVAEGCAADVTSLVNATALPVTSALTRIELSRVLHHLPSMVERAAARALIDDDLSRFSVVEFDAAVMEQARSLVEQHSIGTLDAIHLASAMRVGAEELVTLDRRQASVARDLGFRIPGECGV